VQPDPDTGAAVGGGSRISPPPTTPIASTSPATDTSADRDAAADAYHRFWVVAYTLDSHPVAEWSIRLSAVAAEPLLPQLLDALKTQHASGVREYGQVQPHPVTVEVRGGVATIFDCQDASGAGEAYADSGLPKTVGQARTSIAASLRRGSDGRWRVSEAKQLDSAC
jgi:hypothetical protein